MLFRSFDLMGEKMGCKLNDRDRADIESARNDGILKDVDEFRADLRAGAITVACSDGDQAEDLKNHLHKMIVSQCGFAREHAIGLNGGALVISPYSSLNNLAWYFPALVRSNTKNVVTRFLAWLAWPFLWCLGYFCLRQDWALIGNIGAAIQLKQIKTVVLYVHAPCGAAGLCGMSFRDQLRHLVAAKRRLKKMRAFNGVKFPCFVHVDYGLNGGGMPKKRTYFVDPQEIEDWLKKTSV